MDLPQRYSNFGNPDRVFKRGRSKAKVKMRALFPIQTEYIYLYAFHKKDRMKRFLYFTFILIGLSACKEVFLPPPQALVQVSLLNSKTKLPMSPTVSVQGIGREQLWLKDTVSSEIFLPLSTNDTTSFLIYFDSKRDTVSFIHETYQRYASMETGFYYEFKLKSIEYTHHRIDSISITDSLVIKNWHENIKLYLRPLSAGGN